MNNIIIIYMLCKIYSEALEMVMKYVDDENHHTYHINGCEIEF